MIIREAIPAGRDALLDIWLREPPANRFVLAVNGRPVAFTGPHGQSIDWLDALPSEERR